MFNFQNFITFNTLPAKGLNLTKNVSILSQKLIDALAGRKIDCTYDVNNIERNIVAREYNA